MYKLTGITSDTIINLDRKMSKNLNIIYTRPMDFKTYKNYKMDKWMVSKLLRIIYNFDKFIDSEIPEFNYDTYYENDEFVEFEKCFEFIWEQINNYFKYSIIKLNMDKDIVFNILFNKYYIRFLEFSFNKL